jgi:hypothetical protein
MGPALASTKQYQAEATQVTCLPLNCNTWLGVSGIHVPANEEA